jgi:ADP-dependent NAD(P)H-hydrate dehydratase / NAD(P)H-hydrate epimerase
MLKILSSSQFRALDVATMQAQGISSLELMERAAKACVDWIKTRYAVERPVFIFAGTGNNGGDALAISRLLATDGFNCRNYIVCFAENRSQDFIGNFNKLNREEICEIELEDQFPPIPANAVIVDGIFGSGLSRQVEGIAAFCIEKMNASETEIISIDLPSGLFSDQSTQDLKPVIKAEATLTFQLPKLSFFLTRTVDSVGEMHLMNIGLDSSFLNECETSFHYSDEVKSYASHFKRSKFDHKGKFGHVFVIAGSKGMMGATVLTSKAALRVGAGLVSAHVPKCGYNVLQTAMPEVMCSIDLDENVFTQCEDTMMSKANVIAIGPGLGRNDQTKLALGKLMAGLNKPCILDADALNLIAETENGLGLIPKGSILTPHLKEFERLFGPSSDEFERIQLLKAMSKQYKIFVLLKGAHSALATPEGRVYFNSSGTPGMATAGSGDVLTGVIAGLLAQCNDPFIAALCGMYIHGQAGELASLQNGVQGMIASDIIANLGEALTVTFGS